MSAFVRSGRGKGAQASSVSVREPAKAGRLRLLAAETAVDVGYGLLWAALVIAIVLFSGAVSQFLYVDF